MNDEQLERLTEEAAMFRERSARGEVSRIDDGFMRLREVVSSLKKLKGES